MTDWRIEAFRVWEKMEEPEWANVHYEKPKLQDIAYFSAPKEKPKLNSLDEVDPELVKKYLGTVVPTKDNFYAALNSAVFSDGSFCYIPKGVR